MVLILNGIAALLIRIESIKLLGAQTWVDDPMGAHGACSILSILFTMAASLYVEPMRSDAELSWDASQMPVAGLLDIWLTSISDFDASVH